MKEVNAIEKELVQVPKRKNEGVITLAVKFEHIRTRAISFMNSVQNSREFLSKILVLMDDICENSNNM
jgi:hypothetical protein